MYKPAAFSEYDCPVCGQTFVCQNWKRWAYRKQFQGKIYICCSWKCFRIIDEKVEKTRTKRGRKKRTE